MERNTNYTVEYLGPLTDPGIEYLGPLTDPGIEYLGPLTDPGIEYLGPLEKTSPKLLEFSTTTGKPTVTRGGFQKDDTLELELETLEALTPEQQVAFLEKLSPHDLQKVDSRKLDSGIALTKYYELEPSIDGMPWMDLPMAMTMGGGVGAKLASKGGTWAAAKVGTRAALTAGALEPIFGGIPGAISEKHPKLAPVAALLTGTTIGIGAAKLAKQAKIPVFKDTIDALIFGEKATKEQVKVLEVLRKKSLEKTAAMWKQGKKTHKSPAFLTEIKQGQFYREAIEANKTGIPDFAKKIIATRTDTPHVLELSPLAKAFKREFQGTEKSTKERAKIGSAIWDKWIIGKGQKILEKIPGGKTINRALNYGYRGNLKNTAKYLHSVEDMYRAQRIGAEYAIDVGNRLNALPESTQLKMGEVIRGGQANLNKAEQELVNETKLALYDLGKQAVNAGLLSEEVFFKNAGRYMPRLYTKHEYRSLLKQFGLPKANQLDMSRFIKRKDISPEIRKELGEILTPAYPVAKGIRQLTHDISMAKFFNGIAANSDWAITHEKLTTKKIPAVTEYLQEIGKITKEKSVIIPDGWRQLPDTKKLGKLKGAYVDSEIYDDLMQTIHVAELPEKVWNKTLGMWKFGKVIMSPKTHMRNTFSNSVLAHLGGMPIYKQPKYLIRAAKAMATHNETYVKAWEQGLMSNTFTNAELRDLYGKISLVQLEGKGPEQIFGVLGLLDRAWAGTKKIGNKAAKVYEAEEQIFKLAKMIHNTDKGMNIVDACADAEKWLFNYGKITKFQHAFRTKWYGAPFATFTFKALPRIAETATTKPWRLALPLATIYGLEEAARYSIGDTKEQAGAKKELRPEWMQGEMFGASNFPRVSIVDEPGREYYLNLTYMLPWGDIGEAGRFMGIPGGILPLSQPFVKEPLQQILNYDNFWEQPIVKETDLAGKTLVGKIKAEISTRGKHAIQTLAPTPVMDTQKIYAAIKDKPDYRGRTRPTGVVLADVLAGIKMYPVDYAEQMQRKINKIDPIKGSLAKRIMSQIKTLKIKQKVSKDKKFYQKQIDSKIKQLQGLAMETGILSKKFKKIGGK